MERQKIFVEMSLRDQATIVANTMGSSEQEKSIDGCNVVVRIGSEAYNNYLKGKVALLIGKCENNNKENFAIFVTH